MTSNATVVVNDDRPAQWHIEGGHVIAGHGNVGFARGVETGMRARESDYTLIVNPDCTIDSTSAERFFLHLQGKNGVLLPMLEKSPGSLDVNIYQSWVFTPTRRVSKMACALFLKHSKSDRLPKLVKAPGTFLAMPTSLALELGGPFDTSFYLYGEDRDLTLRARRAKVPLILDRTVKVLHPGGGSAEGMRELVERAKADGMLRVAFRQYGRFGVLAMAANLIVEAAAKDLLRRSTLLAPRRWAIARWSAAWPRAASRLHASDLHDISTNQRKNM